MIITSKTTVTFSLPKEGDLAAKFKIDHPDWIEIAASGTGTIGYKKEETFLTSEDNKE